MGSAQLPQRGQGSPARGRTGPGAQAVGWGWPKAMLQKQSVGLLRRWRHCLSRGSRGARFARRRLSIACGRRGGLPCIVPHLPLFAALAQCWPIEDENWHVHG